MHTEHDTITAPATASGGAISVIRICGKDAIAIVDKVFRGRKSLSEVEANSLHYGHIIDQERIVDEIVASIFRAPRSYTGDDTVEISCHGSRYIVSEILRLLINGGARMATPGEFTTRAFLAGKMDLTQAEAVADMIASSSRAAHAMAWSQMRGGFASALALLRSKLVQLTSMLELELDFSEEDVEFVDRAEIRQTITQIGEQIERLRNSFSLGNALKQGITVAIVGAPNVGKSTLLNRLLGEERAMVSEIAGTTRDAIEETLDVKGVLFRFIDTAGIRNTDDKLERMGIERSFAAAQRAQIIIHICTADTVLAETAGMMGTMGMMGMSMTESGLNLDNKALHTTQRIIKVINKIDLSAPSAYHHDLVAISAKDGIGIDELLERLRQSVDTESVYHGDAIISSARHFEALTSAQRAITRTLTALDTHLTADLLSEDIRDALHHLGTITGEITSDEILANIFSKFCIGK